MRKNVTAVLLAGLIVLAVLGAILTVHHLQSGSKSSPTSGPTGNHQAPKPAGDSDKDKPLTAYPEPCVSSLKNEPQLIHDGKPPETMGELEAVLGHHHGLLAGGASGVTLGEENAILRLQIIRSETGEVITAEDRWNFALQQLSFTASKFIPESGGRRPAKVYTGFSGFEGNSLAYYFVIAHDYRDERYATCGGIIPPGERFAFYGDTLGEKDDFYAEFIIPKDVKPGTCVTFNIPAGVGVHPSLRPKKRMQIQLDPEAKPPVKADKWMAVYHLYSAYDRSSFISNPRQGEFDKTSRMADLGHVKLGEALTVTNPDRSVTWMYVKQADGFNVQLPQNADFVLEDAEKLRQVPVTIPALLGKDGRQPKHLVVGVMNDETFIPLTRTALTERFRPRGAIESEHRLLSEVKISWLPGTYHVVIKGSPYGGMSDKEMNNLTLEQRMEMFRIPPRMLSLATGTLTIPDNSADSSNVQIENLELIDLETYLEPLQESPAL